MKKFLIVKSRMTGEIMGNNLNTMIIKASSREWALKKILIKYPKYYLDHELTQEEINRLS